MRQVYDLAIIGGGINGCGVARDAAGRGYSVFLCEMGDLGQGTSSRSTKLIHGGLRYLEQYDFRLVRESLLEREVIWGIAPHIVRPLRFVLPHRPGLRPAWMLRAGLFLYDHLGGRRRLPATRVVDLDTDHLGAPLKAGIFTRGFEYSDCWVDDARLVVLNARDAADRGAMVRTRSRAVAAARRADAWQLEVADASGGARQTVAARVLVNAAGPWVEQVLEAGLGSPLSRRVRLVQGSHIVVPKLFEHDRAYIFQNPDGRIVFAIPYEGDFTLIGTTEHDYTGDPAKVGTTPEECAYLCAAANAAFAREVQPADIVWSYSGVRPLHDDGAAEARATSREYVLQLDTKPGPAPLLSIIGGKITTYRRLAEAVLERLAPHLPQRQGQSAGWTGTTPLPGGEFDADELGPLTTRLMRSCPFLDAAHAARLVRAYGTLARRILEDAKSVQDLGRQFGATLSEAEVRYLMAQEWAATAEDVLWRRTKLGLRVTPEEAAALEDWMRDRVEAPAAASRP